MRLVVLLAMATITMQLSAEWVQTNGPTGVSSRALAVSGTNIFAGRVTGSIAFNSGGHDLRIFSSWFRRMNITGIPDV